MISHEKEKFTTTILTTNRRASQLSYQEQTINRTDLSLTPLSPPVPLMNSKVNVSTQYDQD